MNSILPARKTCSWLISCLYSPSHTHAYFVLFCFVLFDHVQDPSRVREAELTLQARLADAKRDVRRCLCDDFDTPSAVVALQELVKAVNKVWFISKRERKEIKVYLFI